MPAGWSGQPTGRIPLSMMTQLRDDIGASGYAQSDAASAYLAMAAEYQARFGKPMAFSEFYRTYERQDYYYQGWLKRLPGFNPAAPPWAGKHEEALAIDFAYPLTSWTTPEQAWFRQNEARFGFSSAQGIADGEPWHKVYIGPTPTLRPLSLGATPIITTPEDDEMPVVVQVMDVPKIPLYALAPGKISHLTSTDAAANLKTFKQPAVVQLTTPEFNSVLKTLCIPVSKVYHFDPRTHSIGSTWCLEYDLPGFPAADKYPA